MRESKASRTLLKSPPELWSEVSTATSLQRHMDQFGEIQITKLEPETAVAWEGEHARGTITLEVSGWGTKVSLTAEPMGTGSVDTTVPEAAGVAEPVPAADLVEPELAGERVEPEPVGESLEPEPVGESVEAEGAGERVEPEPADGAAPTKKPRWTRRMARAFQKWLGPPPPEDASPVAQTPEPEPEVRAAPPAPVAPPEPAPIQEPAPQLDTASAAALDAALDSLGQAHHRPFSRA